MTSGAKLFRSFTQTQAHTQQGETKRETSTHTHTIELAMAESHNFKVVLLGEGCVGKTSLVIRYVQDEFYAEHRTTIQASFLSKRITVDNAKVNIAIWVSFDSELLFLIYFFSE